MSRGSCRTSAVSGACSVALTLLGLIALGGRAVGEVVILRDGRGMAGDCHVSGKNIAISGGSTTRYIPRAMVDRVELVKREQEEFEELREKLQRAGAEGQYRLGKWLDDHLQFAQADEYYRKAIELDTNHKSARRVLGYRRAGRDWVAVPSQQLARASMGFGRTAADACVTLGKGYAEKENAKAAENAFRKALVAYPYHTEALQLIQPYLADYKPRHAYRTPLVGRTVVVSGHNHKLAAYMYHAVDLALVGDEGRLSVGDPSDLESYRSFGAPVYAAAAGEVIDAKNDFPDTPIGRLGLFLKANSVCIRHAGGEFTLYAHLKQHSVVVRKGQHVKAGQLLGKVGNSGSSWRPHLHFCLYDTDGISLPVTFTEPEPAADE